jgi:hypothetical protein
LSVVNVFIVLYYTLLFGPASSRRRHPIVYCTAETAKEWKDTPPSSKEGEGGYLLSTLTSLVRRITTSSTGASTESSKHSKVDEEDNHQKKTPAAPQVDQYYTIGAAVSTAFGHGRVHAYRPSHGFYHVHLTNCKLANGQHPSAFLTNDALSHHLAQDCQEGGAVLTALGGGLSGTLASVEPTTGVHVVTIPHLNMVCYLQPDAVIMPLKAAVGDEVVTPYGEGTVTKFRLEDHMYEIQLSSQQLSLSLSGGASSTTTTGTTPANTPTTLYCQAECLTRLDNNKRQQDSDGYFGMDWFLRILTFNAFGGGGGGAAAAPAPPTPSEKSVSARNQRSRSNSVASQKRRKGSISD